MRSKTTLLVFMGIAMAGVLTFSNAQPPQIPTTQIPNRTEAEGRATVGITSRSDAMHAGTFGVGLKLNYDPAVNPYPVGTVEINVDLTDSMKCKIVSSTVEQLTSYGKHTPTVIVSGRCDVTPSESDRPPSGCRYWLLLADNTKDPSADHTKNTPDVVSFFVENNLGQRLAYGTGTVVRGDIVAKPTN